MKLSDKILTEAMSIGDGGLTHDNAYIGLKYRGKGGIIYTVTDYMEEGNTYLLHRSDMQEVVPMDAQQFENNIERGLFKLVI